MNPNTDATDTAELLSSQQFVNDTDLQTARNDEFTIIGPSATIVTTSRNEFIRFRVKGNSFVSSQNRVLLFTVRDNGVDVATQQRSQGATAGNTYADFTWTFDYFADPGTHALSVRFQSTQSDLTRITAGFSITYEHRTIDRERVFIDTTDPWTYT